jgi:hypothetical protein
VQANGPGQGIDQFGIGDAFRDNVGEVQLKKVGISQDGPVGGISNNCLCILVSLYPRSIYGGTYKNEKDDRDEEEEGGNVDGDFAGPCCSFEVYTWDVSRG